MRVLAAWSRSMSPRRSTRGSPCRGRPSGSRGLPSATTPSPRCRRPRPRRTRPPPRSSPSRSGSGPGCSSAVRSGRRVGIVAGAELTVRVPLGDSSVNDEPPRSVTFGAGRPDLDVERPPAPVQALERHAARQLRRQHRIQVDPVLAPAQPREAEGEGLREAAGAGEEVVGRRARERIQRPGLVPARLRELRERVAHERPDRAHQVRVRRAPGSPICAASTAWIASVIAGPSGSVCAA